MTVTVQTMTAGKINRDMGAFEVYDERGEEVLTVTTYDMWSSKLWQVRTQVGPAGDRQLLSLSRKTSKEGVLARIVEYVEEHLSQLEELRKDVADFTTTLAVLERSGASAGVAGYHLVSGRMDLMERANKLLKGILPYIKDYEGQFDWIQVHAPLQTANTQTNGAPITASDDDMARTHY